MITKKRDFACRIAKKHAIFVSGTQKMTFSSEDCSKTQFATNDCEKKQNKIQHRMETYGPIISFLVKKFNC